MESGDREESRHSLETHFNSRAPPPSLQGLNQPGKIINKDTYLVQMTWFPTNSGSFLNNKTDNSIFTSNKIMDIKAMCKI